MSEKKKRISWDRYFMNIAGQVRTRATCDRKHIGAVIVRDKRILTTGYNGSVAGAAHCDDVGHFMVETHCIRTLHAEANAIAHAARSGVALEGATLYCTALPCGQCIKLIVNSGITHIIYEAGYRSEEVLAMYEEIIGRREFDAFPDGRTFSIGKSQGHLTVKLLEPEEDGAWNSGSTG